MGHKCSKRDLRDSGNSGRFPLQLGDAVRDASAHDARVTFLNGRTHSTDNHQFTAGSWTTDEITTVDIALQTLVRVGRVDVP